LKQTNTS